MIYEIANKFISVSINSLGAEPMSIRSKSDDLEYLWQGDPKYWIRRSPTLFPIIGTFKDNKYIFNDVEYEIELHGFAKVSEFELVDKGDDFLVLKLKENAETLKKYPFKFELYTIYKLLDNELKIVHKVINTNNENMWFSIGEHPGFNCPLMSNESVEDYSLVFDSTEKTNRKFIENGMLTDQQELFLDNENEIKLSPAIFERKVIILSGLNSKSVSLVSQKSGKKVTVSIGGYPYLGIWSPETGAPFVCIEPWHGIFAKVDDTRELCKKEGINELKAGEIFECSYSITIR